jgi:hypothetical protein
MKELYKFKVKNGEKEVNFILKKPTRTEIEDVEIFYASVLSKYMNMGIQTRAAVDKYYADNTDGAMVKEDEKEMIRLRKELFQKEEELLQSATDKDARLKLYQEITEITDKIRNFNNYYSSIYDNTAEVKARNKTIDFCLLNLSYIDEGEPKPLFPSDIEDCHKRMLAQFEKYEELCEDEFYRDNTDKLVFLFTVWYQGAAEKFEEFDELFKTYYKEDIEEEPKEELEKENE